MSNAETERQREIAAIVAAHYNDPYGLVMALFPWGQEYYYDDQGNRLLNPLRDKSGPEQWQKEELIALGEHMRENALLRSLGLETKVWRSAYASGHGVGKSAFVAWIIIILMSTRVDTRGVVTASTQFQLEDKTWPELGKWHQLALNRSWFKWSATAFTFAAYPEDKQKNYRTVAATVSKDNTEAFQGLHNEGKTVFVLFDEASGVDDKIWVVANGAVTDGEGFLFALGNPTKPDGAFANVFMEEEKRAIYRTRNIDSRDVSFSNKAELATQIKLYGEDSDDTRVRIKGEFPAQSYNGFFDMDAVERAMRDETEDDSDDGQYDTRLTTLPNRDAALYTRDDPLYMMIDVANTGPDETVIGFRRGWDARSIPMTVYKGLKTDQIVEAAAKLADMYRPDGICIENVGPGIGVADYLVKRGYTVIRIFPGAPSADEGLLNVRMENHWKFRDWIYNGGRLQKDATAKEQMRTIQYVIDKTSGKMRMESKEDIKKRGLPSPDRLDMYTLSFHVRIARRDRNNQLHQDHGRRALLQEDPTEL